MKSIMGYLLCKQLRNRGLRPWSQTMVLKGAKPWGRGRSEFSKYLLKEKQEHTEQPDDMQEPPRKLLMPKIAPQDLHRSKGKCKGKSRFPLRQKERYQQRITTKGTGKSHLAIVGNTKQAPPHSGDAKGKRLPQMHDQPRHSGDIMLRKTRNTGQHGTNRTKEKTQLIVEWAAIDRKGSIQ